MMKKQEKLDILRLAMAENRLLSTFFTTDGFWTHGYVYGVSERLFLSLKEDDFVSDGWHVRKISTLQSAEFKHSTIEDINRKNGLTEGVSAPGIDLTDWETVFSSVCKADVFLQVEDGLNGRFWIGRAEEVCSGHVVFRAFDADGVWAETENIDYSEITSVSWDTRYANTWQKYLENAAAENTKAE